ncbi:MAG TPA: tripartite tricarboxylate transporter substrate binding protein [Casimicrobiaceae bacterium]|nr:tripartite tricarboxylate transporter substrate binding protein [Casimicrobiaceae bacterium]
MTVFARRLVAVVFSLLASATIAQNFPNRPVTLIVPWPAGGSTDQVMRALAQATEKHLGQPIVVENKAGAAGTLGATAMVTAKPDGYTVTQIPISIFRLPHTTKVGFDPLNDLTYLIGVSGYTFGVAVRSDAPWKTFQEMVAFAKANPGKLTFGTPGANTSLHITMEEIAYRYGIQWTHVPFKGNADNMQALLGGHVDSSADATGWGPHVDAGKMRLLVTWGGQRTKRWKEVPTLKELGYDIVSTSPYGIAGPKGMDPKIAMILHDAFKKGMEDPIHMQAMEKYDQDLIYMSSEDYAKFARKTFEEEKATMTRLAVTQK